MQNRYKIQESGAMEENHSSKPASRYKAGPSFAEMAENEPCIADCAIADIKGRMTIGYKLEINMNLDDDE